MSGSSSSFYLVVELCPQSIYSSPDVNLLVCGLLEKGLTGMVKPRSCVRMGSEAHVMGALVARRERHGHTRPQLCDPRDGLRCYIPQARILLSWETPPEGFLEDPGLSFLLSPQGHPAVLSVGLLVPGVLREGTAYRIPLCCAALKGRRLPCTPHTPLPPGTSH